MAAESCPDCSRSFGLFRWRHHCAACQTVRCSKCLRPLPDERELCVLVFSTKKGDGLCRGCDESVGAEHRSKYEAALAGADRIRDWSINYAGRVPVDYRATYVPLESLWFKTRQLALANAKVTAAYLGYEVLYAVDYRHRLKTFSEPGTGKGIHYYNEPRYSVAAKAAKLGDGICPVCQEPVLGPHGHSHA